MRPPSILVLFSLSILLLREYSAWAKLSSKGSTTSRNSSSSSSSHHKPSHGFNTHSSSYPKQPQNPSRGGNHDPYPAGGSYPNQKPGVGGYPNQHPAGGYPVSGSYTNLKPGVGGYPNQPRRYPGGYPSRGGQRWGQGGYAAGFPNWNPNNKILSPRYSGGYGGGAFGKGGGSSFSHSVQSMGYLPNVKSMGFAKKAALAVGVGVAKRVAVDYGLGRFPRPNFSFRSPQEEYYYNRYMYQRYGLRSTDENDFGRDYRYTQPGQSYDRFMDSCLKRTDLLRGQEGGEGAGLQGEDPSAVANGSEAGASALFLGNGIVNATSDLETMNGTERNSTPPPEIHKALPVSPPGGEKELREGEKEDTVSLMEIGYPELIEQMKVRRCVELYMAYSHHYLEKQTEERLPQGPSPAPSPSPATAPQQCPLCQGVLDLLTSALTFMSSSVLLQ